MGQSILVVDDDPQLRAIIVILLQDEGYEVRQAPDAMAALGEIERRPPDLVLSDVRMPQLTGLELAERLGHRPDPIPVILMSADGAVRSSPAVPFLPKPVSVPALLSAIAAVFATCP